MKIDFIYFCLLLILSIRVYCTILKIYCSCMRWHTLLIMCLSTVWVLACSFLHILCFWKKLILTVFDDYHCGRLYSSVRTTEHVLTYGPLDVWFLPINITFYYFHHANLIVFGYFTELLWGIHLHVDSLRLFFPIMVVWHLLLCM